MPTTTRHLINTTLIFLGLLFFSCSQKKEDLRNRGTDFLDLHGQVLSVTQTTREADSINGQLVKSKRGHNPSEWHGYDFYIELNRNGFITKEITFNVDGKTGEAILYKYNPENYLVEQRTYAPPDCKFYEMQQYVVNRNGYCVEEYILRAKSKWADPGEEKPYKRVESDYDNNGNTTETRYYYSTGEVESKSVMEYDKNNKLILLENYYRDSLENKRVLVNDSHGNNIEYTFFDGNGKVMFRGVCAYDQHNNRIGNIEYDENNKIKLQCKYSYDQNNHETMSTRYDANNRILFSSRSEYDLKGHVVKELFFDSLGSQTYYATNSYVRNANDSLITKTDDKGLLLQKTIYEFDNKSNWIKKIKWENDSTIFITEREIKYYN